MLEPNINDQGDGRVLGMRFGLDFRNYISGIAARTEIDKYELHHSLVS